MQGESRFAAIFDKSSGPSWVARHGLTSAAYQREFDNRFYQGYRVKSVSGYAAGGTAHSAAIWESQAMSAADLALIDKKISAYMSSPEVPGLSIAISKDDRLVYAEGFGNADAGNNEHVSPNHLFRIASISKTVTSVAILDLVEAGKLKVDDKVFGEHALLGTRYGTSPYSDGVKKITVRHLLQHVSGWSMQGGDPMFSQPGMNQSQLIGWVLDNRPLKHAPGSSYEYLNFGYCVLGRVIEAVTGQSYEAHVRGGVLKACGIARMQLGHDTLAERIAGEVMYYGAGAYDMEVRRMDANGGWIATPIDLLRLLARTDGFGKRADLLEPATEADMSKGSKANPSYGEGSIVDPAYRGHNGAMPGTIAFLVRRNDGFSFAVTANTRPSDDAFCFTLKGVLDANCTGVSKFPSYDLF